MLTFLSSWAASLPPAPKTAAAVAALPDDAEICGCNGGCKGKITGAIAGLGLKTLDEAAAGSPTTS